MQVEKQTETEAAGPPAARPRWKAFLSGAGWGGGLCFLVIAALGLGLGLAIVDHLVLLMIAAGALLGGWFARPGGPVGFVVCAAPAVRCWMYIDNGFVMDGIINGDPPIGAWYFSRAVFDIMFLFISVVLPGALGGLIVRRKDKGLPVWG